MIVRDLGMLTRFFAVTLFVRRSGLPVRFGGFVMMRGGFVVVVFWHYGYFRAFRWPCMAGQQQLRGEGLISPRPPWQQGATGLPARRIAA